MQKSQIKQKLLNFYDDFKKEQGGFKSLEVLYEYCNFLQSEKFTKGLLKDKWEYAEKQKEVVTKGATEMDLNSFSLDPKNLSALPGFSKEMSVCQKRIDKGIERLDIYDMVPIMILSLLIVTDVMSSIKNNKVADSLNAHNIDISKLMENAKNASMSFSTLKVAPDKNITIDNSKFLESAVQVLNKYIIDQIDSEEFLTKGEDKSKLSFDKKKSELNIFGDIIKIQLRSDKPNDHYILEYLFALDNIFDEADFRDIAETKLGMSEYDSSKDWNILRHACDNLNKKIAKATDEKEKEFLIYTTGKTGYCKINPKYL